MSRLANFFTFAAVCDFLVRLASPLLVHRRMQSVEGVEGQEDWANAGVISHRGGSVNI